MAASSKRSSVTHEKKNDKCQTEEDLDYRKAIAEAIADAVRIENGKKQDTRSKSKTKQNSTRGRGGDNGGNRDANRDGDPADACDCDHICSGSCHNENSNRTEKRSPCC